MIPEKGSKARNDMVMKLIDASMQSAQESGSPILSALAPIVGAMAGNKSQSQFDEAEAARNQEMTQALLGNMMSNPKAIASMQVLNDPNAPAHLRSIATSQLAAIMKPKGRGGRGAGPDAYRRPPSNTDALMTRLLYGAMSPDSEGGESISSGEQARIDAVRTARSRSRSTAVDPFDQFLEGGAPAPAAPAAPAPAPQALDENDPLGILGLPPA